MSDFTDSGDLTPHQPRNSTKAPSEKHLQDYIWNNPECLHDDYELEFSEPMELFGYEFELPRGRVDILGSGWMGGWNVIWAIELKKDALTLSSLAQVLRYVSDIQRIWDFALAGLHDINNAFLGVDHRPQVRGILVGHSCTEDLLVAADAANVCVYTYSYDESYTLTYRTQNLPHNSEYLPYHDSDLGDRIRGIHTGILSMLKDQGVDWSNKLTNFSINDLWKLYGGAR